MLMVVFELNKFSTDVIDAVFFKESVLIALYAKTAFVYAFVNDENDDSGLAISFYYS